MADPTVSNHPSRRDLGAFELGQLPEKRATEIEQHVEACNICCETLMELSSSDTFLNLARKANDANGAQDLRTAPNRIPSALLDHPRYEVLTCIGHGGMGAVYEARHRVMDRKVALKIIHPSLVENPEAVQRFHREAQAAAKLAHPHIVTAHDAEQADQLHFLVMEFVPGTDLAALVHERGPLAIADACRYVSQAAIGLQHAHERGMVHRDLKPHNLIVTKDNNMQDQIKILDFGLASLVETSPTPQTAPQDSGLTAVGSIIGTPDFIAPEQAANAAQADIRSDVYSLGATLYFLLTGQPPFPAGTVREKLHAHASQSPPPVATLRREAPAALQNVLDRMLAKDPDLRFQTPCEIAAALEPFASPPTKPTPQPIPPQRLPKAPHQPSPRTARLLVVLATCGFAAVLLFATALAVSYLTLQTDRKAGPTPTTRESVVSAPQPEAPTFTSVWSSHGHPFHFAGHWTDLNFSEDTPWKPEYRDILAKRHGSPLSNRARSWMWASVQLEGDAVAYLRPPNRHSESPDEIVASSESARDVPGSIQFPHDGKLIKLKFTLPTSVWKRRSSKPEPIVGEGAAGASPQQRFHRVAHDHFQYLLFQRVPGAAWFRHLRDTVAMDLPDAWTRKNRQSWNTMDWHYQGRWLSETLDLAPVPSQKDMNIEELPSINFQPPPIEASPDTLRQTAVAGDRLANNLPHDQHAFLFSSFPALVGSLDHARQDGLPMLQHVGGDTQFDDIVAAYQAQLGLELSELTRMLGDKVVRSVAITGSDPLFGTGADVAIVFAPHNAKALMELLHGVIALQAAKHKATARPIEFHGADCHWYSNQDRTFCAYLTTIGPNVVVSNSKAQLEVLQDVQQRSRPQLSHSPDYRHVRRTYPNLGHEHGLFVVTSETIRRWLSPSWKIAAHRRLHGRAHMAAAQAEYLDLRSQGLPHKDSAHLVAQRPNAAALGITIDGEGHVSSTTLGNLAFLTPIIEQLPKRISKEERDAYNQWKQNQSQYGLRQLARAAVYFEAHEDSWRSDIVASSLPTDTSAWIAELFQGVHLRRPEHSPHPSSVFRISAAVNKLAKPMMFVNGVLKEHMPPPLDQAPFAWFGSSIDIYFNPDPKWLSQEFELLHVAGAPIAIHFEIAHADLANQFLEGLERFFTQNLRYDVAWKESPATGKGPHRYAVFQPQQKGAEGPIFAAASTSAIVICFQESMLLEALDNAAPYGLPELSRPRNPAAEAFALHAAPMMPQLEVETSGKFTHTLQPLWSLRAHIRQQQEAWNQLPILNAWKRHFPDTSPQEMQQEFWPDPLAHTPNDRSPFRWNESWNSMEPTQWRAPDSVSEIQDEAFPWQSFEGARMQIAFPNATQMHTRIEVIRAPR